MHDKAGGYLLWLVVSTIFCSEFWIKLGFDNDLFVINPRIRALINTVLMERHAASVIIGVMIYFLSTNTGNRYFNVGVLVLAFLRNMIIVGLWCEVCILLLSFAVMGAYNSWIKFPNSRVLDKLSTISFSLYLIHQNVGYAILDYMEKKGIASEWAIFIPMIISIGIAWFVTFAIEKPLISYLGNNRKERVNNV